MRIHLRADSADGVHTKVTVFMNGAYCGRLTMREEEAVFFHDTILNSGWIDKEQDDVYSSGVWIKEKEENEP